MANYAPTKLKAIYTLLLLLALTLGGVAADKCPLCKGNLSTVGTIKDDTSQPSLNLSVWNRSICANFGFSETSPICTTCWHAYSKVNERWERSSENPLSFTQPLSPAIRGFPLPPKDSITSSVVYSHEFASGISSEALFFWCRRSEDYLRRARKYAEEHKLKLRIETADRLPLEIYLYIDR